MYAVIEVGGRQFKVEKGVRFSVEDAVKEKEGSAVDIKKALLVKEGNSIHVGAPYVKGAHVTCAVVRRFKGQKTIAFKYRRRKNSKQKIGGRQHMVELEVQEIGVEK